MSEPEAIDLGAVAGGDEGLDLVVADEGHDRRELVLGEQGLDLDMQFAAIAALDVIERTATHQVLDDITADTFRLVGDDADTLALVERGGEIVDGKTVDPRTGKTDDHHAEVVDQEGGAADDSTGDRYRLADIVVDVLVDDLSQDIESSGGGIDAEHKGLASREEQHEAEQVEPYIALLQAARHDGRANRLQHLAGTGEHIVVTKTVSIASAGTEGGEDSLVVISRRREDMMGKIGIRIDTVEHLGERTENHGGIDRLGAKLVAYQDKSHDEQHGIDAHDDIGERIGIATYGGIDDDTKTRDRTYDEVTRHEEIIDGGCAEYHTYGHHEKLDPELAGEQRLSELGQDRLTIEKNLMHGNACVLFLD